MDLTDKNIKQNTVSVNVSEVESNLEENSLKESHELLNIRLKNKVIKNMIKEVRKFYRQEMDKYHQKTSFLSKEKLIENNESVLKRTSDMFEFERGIMSLDNYRKLIEISIEDIYGKIVVRNAINSGTTKNCVESNLEENSLKLLNIRLKNQVIKNMIKEVRKFYRQEMDKYYEKTSFLSKEKLIENNESVLKRTSNMFEFEKRIMSSDNYRKLIEISIEDIYEKIVVRLNINAIDSFNTKVTEAKESYIQEMNSHFENNTVFTDEELKQLQEKALSDAINTFEGLSFVLTNGFDVEKYSNDLKQQIYLESVMYGIKNQINRDLRQRDLKDIVNEYIDSYNEQIETLVDMANSELELIQHHENIKGKIITEFKQKAVSANVSEVESLLENLEEKIESSLKDAIDILGLHIMNQESVAKNLKTSVRKYYRQEMEKYYRKTSFISKEKLIKNNESVVKRTFDEFESERGDMSLNDYQKLIENSVKDIYDKIVAENNMNAPTLPVIGIDLGMTNSCVAYYKADGRNTSSVVVIPNEMIRNVTPSVVSIRNGGKVVGDVAKEEARAYPLNTIYSAKRFIGRRFSDTSVKEDMKLLPYDVIDDRFDNPKFKVLVNGTEETYSAEQISAEVLKKMKEIAENYLGLKILKAVITVPAYFNDAQKEATKRAGKLAGLQVLRIINEPTAAALAFKLNKSDEYNSRKVLVYNLGAETFDVSVLNVDKDEIKVMAVGGDNHFGGNVFDTKLIEYCLSEFRSKTGYDVSNCTVDGALAIFRLGRVCEENKCKLSSFDMTTIVIDSFYQSEDLRVELTRDKFEELNEEYFVKSMDFVVQTLQDAGLDQSEIDHILLVGCSTRIPRIQDLLWDQFGGRPLNYTVNPDEAVAVGAAIQAAIINGEKAQELGHLRVVDVAPMSLGIKLKDGFMSVIIPRNSSVHNTYERIYETVCDNQTTFDVEVFEIEEQITQNNRSLGKFELKGIPAAPKGEQTIKVLFEITDEGILRVTANIVSTGGEQEIEIKEHKGRLSHQELQQLIDQGN